MAKKAFDIGDTIGSILKIVVFAIIGLIAWFIISNKFLKSKKEAQDEEEAKKKGALRSFFDFFAGDGASENLFPTSSSKDQQKEKSRDASQDSAIADAEKQVAEIEQQIKERDNLAQNLTEKTIGATELDQTQKDQLFQDNKQIAEKIVKAKAEQNKAESDARARGEKLPPKISEQIIDRSSDAFKVFRFKNPIQTKSETKTVDFAVADQSKITKKQLEEIKKTALNDVKKSGFNTTREIKMLNGQKKTVTEKPIVALKPSTLKRLETDTKLRQQFEEIEKRNLGLRTITGRPKK